MDIASLYVPLIVAPSIVTFSWCLVNFDRINVFSDTSLTISTLAISYGIYTTMYLMLFEMNYYRNIKAIWKMSTLKKLVKVEITLSAKEYLFESDVCIPIIMLPWLGEVSWIAGQTYTFYSLLYACIVEKPESVYMILYVFIFSVCMCLPLMWILYEQFIWRESVKSNVDEEKRAKNMVLEWFTKQYAIPGV